MSTSNPENISAQPAANDPNALGASPAGGASPQGYPTYQQGGYGMPTNGYPAPGVGPMPYPHYQYPPYYPMYYALPRPKRDTYQLVAGIISIIGLALAILGGLAVALLLLILVVSANANSSSQGLSTWTLFPLIAGIALAGGGVGMYLTIRAVMGRPSAIVRLPSFLLPLGLTVVVLGVGVIRHALGQAQGPAPLEAPLVLLAGILPAITIFSLTSERLGSPTTWRHAWISFLSGMLLATLVALILELIASAVLVLVFPVSSTNIQQLDTSSTSNVIFALLVVSVIAPLAEEGFKPIGPLVIIGRLHGPAEAFLVGMASGIGFDVFETIGYIGQGQADWIIVAVERVGAGLLHGVGAGMATLGWYYLFRGKGAPQRYWKGFGAIIYAILQHAIFNGANFLAIVPGPIGDALRAPVWFFGLPETGQVYLFVIIYAGIIGVLLTVTQRIRQSPLNQPLTTITAAPTSVAVPAAVGPVVMSATQPDMSERGTR